MGRTDTFARVIRALRTALVCERDGLSTDEGLARAARMSRRAFLGTTSAAAAGCAIEAGTGRSSEGLRLSGDVAVVGAGLAGLACADALAAHGIAASVYEAADRVGGRCWSLRGFFPGQVAERGGELIDTLHGTMRGYARELGLTLEARTKEPGEAFFYFDGARVPESTVVDEWRAFVPAIQADLRALGEPTADSFTEADRELDLTSLAEYLETRGASPVIQQALDVAYTIEYGLETDRQSCLNLLLFMHADRRSRFQPFGVFSDEKYHVVEGNDAIPEGLAARLPRAVEHGMELVRVSKRSDGRIQLDLRSGSSTVRRTHDAVVLSVPFSVLRGVTLDASLGLPAWKTDAIETLGYGTNSKLMVGFAGKPWRAHGGNGDAYADLPSLQNTWETNASVAGGTSVLTDYTGGDLGASLDPRRTDRETASFLADLERVFPGASAAASRDARGRHVAHLEAWPTNPYSRGSYTCNQPGYFTTIAGNEAKPVDNLFFAGEHTDSFYEWQGFMEGAALSGLRAAGEVVARIRGRA